MQLIKIISTEVDKLNRRVAKFLRYGRNDTQTALQAAPPGVDANPIRDMVAVYAPTSEKGDTVVIGYINKNQVAQPGEHRIFSINSNGEVQTSVHLKANGVIVITGQSIEFLGSAKTLARFQELKSGFDQLRDDLNSLISTFNSHVHTGVQTGPGSSAATTTQGTPSTASVDGSEASNLKTA